MPQTRKVGAALSDDATQHADLAGEVGRRDGDAVLRRVLSPIFLCPSSGRRTHVQGDGPAPFDTAQGVPSGVEGRGGQRKIGATHRKTAGVASSLEPFALVCRET